LLAKHTAVAHALAEADRLEDATTELLIAERAHEAVGMDHARLVGFAKQLRLEAEAKALPEKVRGVREAVASTLGLANGAALAARPGYAPQPRVPGAGELLLGAALVVGGVALIGLGVAGLRDSYLLSGVALVGLGVALIGLGVAVLRSSGLLSGVALIGMGVGGIGSGAAILAGAGLVNRIKALTRDPNDTRPVVRAENASEEARPPATHAPREGS